MSHQPFTKPADVLNAVRYQPCVSILISMDTKISLKQELKHHLKLALDETHRQLKQDYPESVSQVVMQRLEAMARDMTPDPEKKALALYASPVDSGFFYLDVPVVPKIVIDRSFEIRDLLLSGQSGHRFLVLVLSGKQARLNLCWNNHLIPLDEEHAPVSAELERDLPEQVTNFSDKESVREKNLERFLRQTDKWLGTMLPEYPFPVFVLAPDKVAGNFKKLSHHTLAGTVKGSFEKAGEQDILEALKPLFQAWEEQETAKLKERLSQALKAGKLVAGVSAVWHAAEHKLGKLLVVEKNFSCAAEHTDKPDYIRKHEASGQGLYIKDAVDDIIERVMINGGNVAFVADGSLEDYMHIALIQYY